MASIRLWNDVEIPRLGMGTWTIGGQFWSGEQPLGWGEVDDRDSVASIRKAVDLGIRYFDTADVYGCGHAEELLAEALGRTGEDIMISTKFGNMFDAPNKQMTGPGTSATYIRSAVEASLRRLRREQIDLVFFHLNEHPIDASGNVFATLSTLRDEGKIAAFGWSTDFTESAEAFAGIEGFVSVQHNMNLFRPAEDMVRLINQRDLISVARQPLAMGLLGGRFSSGKHSFSKSDIRATGPDWQSYFVDGAANPDMLDRIEAIRDLLTSGGRSLAQGALAWIWAKSPRTIPIPGFRTISQIEDNVGALEKGPLSPETMAEIDRLKVPGQTEMTSPRAG